MSRPRRQLRWSSTPPRAIPQHPYRDSAIIYGAFAVVLLLVAWAAGTSIVRAVVLAIGFFVLAMGWSHLSWRRRIRDEARETEL